MNFSHKENAKKLFTQNQIGTYWNDLYKEVKSCLDYFFIRRLEISCDIIDSQASVNDKILDLGCGAGVLTERLIEMGYSVDAADQSQDMLDYTKKRLLKFDASSYQLFKTECEQLVFQDNTYDLTACIGVFGYIDNVDSAVSEIYRSLKPGGTLVMSIRNLDNLNISDLHNIAKILCVKIPKKVFGVIFGNKKSAPSVGSQTIKNVTSKNFIDIWDRPNDVINIFGEHGFKLANFEGTGYGPLQYRKRPLIPAFLGIKVSAGLEYFFRTTGLHKHTRWVADISIYVFKKQ